MDNHLLWNTLLEHAGHKVEIAWYGDKDNPASVTLEDMRTNEVILDAELYTLAARDDGEVYDEDEKFEEIISDLKRLKLDGRVYDFLRYEHVLEDVKGYMENDTAAYSDLSENDCNDLAEKVAKRYVYQGDYDSLIIKLYFYKLK